MTTVYLTSDHGMLSKRGNTLIHCRRGDGKQKIPLSDVDAVVLSTGGSISTPALQMLLREHVPVHYVSQSGRYLGSTTAFWGRGYPVRAAQYEALSSPDAALRIARGVVAGKLLNQRRMLLRFLYRHSAAGGNVKRTIGRLQRFAEAASLEKDMEVLRGFEGKGAADYFSVFGLMLRPPWRFAERNRRPPKDPINAMLSFGYTMLLNYAVTAVLAAGLDPCVGFLHPEFRNRPSMALDLMEEFRPLLVDRLVVALANQSIVKPGQFSDAGPKGVRMTRECRDALIRGFEERLEMAVVSDNSGLRTTFRGHIFHQAGRMAEALLDKRDYIPMVAR